MEVISIIFWLAALAAYSISQLQQHSQLKWMSEDPFGFWGEDSDKRKFARHKDITRTYARKEAPNTWYYKFTRGDWKEAFPLSTTLLVWLTDGYHLAQFVFLKFTIAAILTFPEWTWWRVVYLLILTWCWFWYCKNRLFKK